MLTPGAADVSVALDAVATGDVAMLEPARLLGISSPADRGIENDRQ